jgi:hypothetical protein
MRMVARPCAAAPGGKYMIRETRLAAAFAFAAGLTAAGVALAQTQTGGPAPPATSALPAPPPAQSAPPWAKSETPTFKPSDPNKTQPTYSVDPPPDGSSGVYLPAALLGYAKSAAGCVVVGCDGGPQAGGASGPSSSGPASSSSAGAPPANPGPAGPH